ncbi:hypothetical protein MTP99_017671 [Tenebrio molitor]|nr:hypothetical protein MTP99_017671 [Tenebrio molitor]
MGIERNLMKDRDQGSSSGGVYGTYAIADIDQSDQLKGNDFIRIIDNTKCFAQSGTDECWMKKTVRKLCTKKVLYQRLPILSWLPKYDKSCAVGDLVAGITVGLTVVPQSLAYANIAGLPPQQGLYTAFLGSFIYIVLGSCKDVPMGPTSIASLLTYQSVKDKGPHHAILLCFLTGIVQLLLGFFGLGFLIDFVSGPVLSGFTSAAALMIGSSQIKDLLGIKATGTTFVEMWTHIVYNIGETSLWDAVLGGVSIALLLILKVVTNLKIGPSVEPKKWHVVVNTLFWLVGTSRNVILVVVAGLVGYHFASNAEPPFKVMGDIPPGLPTPRPPPFGFTETKNGTVLSVDVWEMISDLGSGIIVVPLIAILEDISICKAFANGKTVDGTQELIAIGASNLANSFMQAFPGSGSLSRGAINHSSGVKTPLGGLYTGVLVILALLFFTPCFYYIPKAALSAIIITAILFMVEVKAIKPIWKTKKIDVIPALATFVACLAVSLQTGILIGLLIDFMFILYHAARPKISLKKLTSREGTEYLMLTPDRCLMFPSAVYVRNLVTKYSIQQQIPVVIDCSHIYGADYTSATVIEALTRDFGARHQELLFYNLKPSVSSVFEGLSPKGFVAYYNEEEIDELLKNYWLEGYRF